MCIYIQAHINDTFAGFWHWYQPLHLSYQGDLLWGWGGVTTHPVQLVMVHAVGVVIRFVPADLDDIIIQDSSQCGGTGNEFYQSRMI